MRLAVAALVLAACGGGGGTTAPDAPPEDGAVDTPPEYEACKEFGATTANVPAHVTGMLATADVQSPSTCTTVDAKFGIESAGPDNVVRIAQESSKEAPEQGTFSERGFILDGLGGVDQNFATLLLELPKDPVGVGGTWALASDFVNPEPLGMGFIEKKSDRRNTVKLVSLTPEGDDKVATIEYDLFEMVTGFFPPSAAPAPAAGETAPVKAAPEKGKGKDKGGHDRGHYDRGGYDGHGKGKDKGHGKPDKGGHGKGHGGGHGNGKGNGKGH